MEAWIMVNARAGRQNPQESGQRVRRVFALGGAHTRLAYTSTPEEAQAFLEKAAEEQPDVLVCCGGDGTLSQAVNVLKGLGAEIPLGFVPMGTTNDFANSLGISKEPARAAEQILRGSLCPVDLGRFQEKHFLYVASFGAFTQSSYKTDPAMKASFGHLAYILEGAKELPFLKPCIAKVETEEETFEGEFFFGAVSNSTSLGGVVKLDPDRVFLDDGLLELTLVSMPKNPWELGQIAQMLRQGKLQGDKVIQRSVKRVVVSCEEPFPWSLDGEYESGGQQVVLTVQPKALPLMLQRD